MLLWFWLSDISGNSGQKLLCMGWECCYHAYLLFIWQMKHCIRNKTQHCLGEAQKQFESVIGRVMMDLQPYLDFMDIMRDNCRVIDSMKCHMIQGPVSVNGAPLLLPFLLFVQTKNTINHKKTWKAPRHRPQTSINKTLTLNTRPQTWSPKPQTTLKMRIK